MISKSHQIICIFSLNIAMVGIFPIIWKKRSCRLYT